MVSMQKTQLSSRTTGKHAVTELQKTPLLVQTLTLLSKMHMHAASELG